MPATADQLAAIAAGRAPLPGYFLADGTPMVADVHGLRSRRPAGSERVHDWFVAFWPAEDPRTARGGVVGLPLRASTPAWSTQPALDPPQGTRRRARRAARRRLREDPRDHVARGQLAECSRRGARRPGTRRPAPADDRYDRLRFGGGPTPARPPVDGPREEFLNLRHARLPIRTERLMLRRASPADAVAIAPALADPDYARYLLTGPIEPPPRSPTCGAAARPSRPGHRTLGLVMEHEGRVSATSSSSSRAPGYARPRSAGPCTRRRRRPRPATEAARALLDLAFEHYGVRRVVRQPRRPQRALRRDVRAPRHAARVQRRADFWSKGEWTDSHLEYAILAEEWAARRTT